MSNTKFGVSHNEHTTERRKDRNRGEAPHYCGRARSFDGEFVNESGETLHPGVESSHQRSTHESEEIDPILDLKATAEISEKG